MRSGRLVLLVAAVVAASAGCTPVSQATKVSSSSPRSATSPGLSRVPSPASAACLSAEIRSAVQRFVSVWNNRDLSRLQRLLNSDAVLDMSTRDQREFPPSVGGGHDSVSGWGNVRGFVVQRWREGERLKYRGSSCSQTGPSLLTCRRTSMTARANGWSRRSSPTTARGVRLSTYRSAPSPWRGSKRLSAAGVVHVVVGAVRARAVGAR